MIESDSGEELGNNACRGTTTACRIAESWMGSWMGSVLDGVMDGVMDGVRSILLT